MPTSDLHAFSTSLVGMKLTRSRNMTAAKLSGSIGPIHPGVVYPVETFKQVSGLGRFAFKSARREGLKVRKVGGRRFVLGDEFAEFVAAQKVAELDPADDGE